MGRQINGDNGIMLSITFSVVKDKPENPKQIQMDVPDEYYGEYIIRELNAQEAKDIENDLIVKNKDAQENPDAIELADKFQNELMEAAITVNGKPFKMPKLKTVPKRYIHLLIVGFEKINGLSDTEARFLLQPS